MKSAVIDPKCSRCLQSGHRAVECESEVVCRACKKSGHKEKDGKCNQLSDNPREQKQSAEETPLVTSDPPPQSSMNEPGHTLPVQRKENLERGRQESRGKEKQTPISGYMQRRHRSETPSKRLRSDSSSPTLLRDDLVRTLATGDPAQHRDSSSAAETQVT
ncbi:hypothetical protein BaRGS_00030896 [Batillaria attramentaria]|uniref:CCHC-type domain-containing protein n=1 Tax=Batillaria attramentaria TaxID=370345 RepID=A0ABD0JT94_9CAEN